MIKKKKLWVISVLFGIGIIALTHDIIFTNILAYQICRTDPNPKTFIKKTVEYPGSVYWEDNIYPGFDEADRLMMIQNYLDGVHLTTMALNGPDGKIYVYTATKEDWQTSQSIRARHSDGNYVHALAQEARSIADQGKIFSQQSMPKLQYSVVFNPVKLSRFASKYLYSDEVTITDNQNDQIIGYNQRLMRFWYLIAPDIAVGNRYYYPYGAMCGENRIYGFDEHIFIFYQDVPQQPAHIGINRYLYKKFMEDNKHVR